MGDLSKLPPLEIIDWESLYQFSVYLADKIIESGRKYDLLVGVARGGLVPLRIVSEELNMKNILVLRAESYSNINSKKEIALEYFGKDIEISGKSILVIDDLVDSGETLEHISNYLYSKGAKKVDIAVLFYKRRSKVTPDFYVKETDKWVVFPYEARSTLLDIIDILKKQNGVQFEDAEALKSELINIGFLPYDVERVLKIYKDQEKNKEKPTPKIPRASLKSIRI